MSIIQIPLNLPGKIYASPMPFGEYDPFGMVWEEYMSHQVEVIVLLAGVHECMKKSGRNLREVYLQHGLQVIDLPMFDYGVPDPGDLRNAIGEVLSLLQGGTIVAVHCSAGVGRTGLFLTCLVHELVGCDGEKALDTIRQRIKGAVESDEQRLYVRRYCKK